MEATSSAARDTAPPDSALRYLVMASDAERKRWGERAVELGFPREQLRTGTNIRDMLPWCIIVSQEMRDQGLWKESREQELEKPTAKIIQLPLWPEPVRAVPNDILRSALFAAIQGKTREYMKQKPVAACDGLSITYTGEQLDQSDLDVWETVLHLARSSPLGSYIIIRGYALLKLLGRSTGKSDYVWLRSVLTRLQATSVQMSNTKKLYSRSFIEEFDVDEDSNLYKIKINPDLAKLYAAGWTGIYWEQRQLLRGKPLALWLHGFYSSHAAPFPYKVETLRELCGSRTAELFKFRQHLRRALDDLKAGGVIAAWQIDPVTDLVNVDRGAAITDSQRRHLTKPKRQPRKQKN